MTRIKPGGEWTLLYCKTPRRGSVAIAQIPLHEETSMEALRKQIIPEILKSMLKRAAPWQVIFQDESRELEDDETLDVWNHPPANQRFVEAIGVWLELHQRAGVEQTRRSIKRFHALTLETLCSCLLGAPVCIEEKKISPDELMQAVRFYLRDAQRPKTLEGTTLAPS